LKRKSEAKVDENKRNLIECVKRLSRGAARVNDEVFIDGKTYFVPVV